MAHLVQIYDRNFRFLSHDKGNFLVRVNFNDIRVFYKNNFKLELDSLHLIGR